MGTIHTVGQMVISNCINCFIFSILMMKLAILHVFLTKGKTIIIAKSAVLSLKLLLIRIILQIGHILRIFKCAMTKVKKFYNSTLCKVHI